MRDPERPILRGADRRNRGLDDGSETSAVAPAADVSGHDLSEDDVSSDAVSGHDLSPSGSDVPPRPAAQSHAPAISRTTAPLPAPAVAGQPGVAHRDITRLAFVDHYRLLEQVRQEAVARANAQLEVISGYLEIQETTTAAELPTRPRASARARAQPPARGPQPARVPAQSSRAQLRRGERLPMRRDRREEILERLRAGPASAHELAEEFEISREGVLRWLRMLESDGRSVATAAARTSRTNRWVIAGSEGPAARA